MNIYPWAKKLNWDLIRKALSDKPREGFELLQMDLAALEKMAGSRRRGWEGRSCKPGRKSSQKAVTMIQAKGQSGLDQITAMGMERGEELDGSFEAPATLVAATLGHQPAIPIIHRNQSHSVETQIKLVHSNGWRA